MSAELLEPELASQVEQVFAAGEPVLAFPRGRRAQLAAARPRASAVVEVSHAPFTLRHVPADAELVLLDDGPFARATRLARSLPNAVLYRPARPLAAESLRQLGARLAQGGTVALAHDHPGAALAAALAPPALDTRRVAVLAFADELVADPSLLAAWAASVSGADEITLVVAVDPGELDALESAAGAIGTADLLAVPADDLPRLATGCRAVYSRNAAWARLGVPVLGPDPATFEALR